MEAEIEKKKKKKKKKKGRVYLVKDTEMEEIW